MPVRRWSMHLGLVLLAAVAVARVRAAENAVEARLLKDITFLASDVCEGRGTATAGNHIAGEYIADELRKMGVKPGGKNGSYFQPFTVRGSTLEGTPELVLSGPGGRTLILQRHSQFEPLGVAGSGSVANAPVVFAGYGLTATRLDKDGKRETFYDDYEGLDAKGKVVIVLQAMPNPEKMQGSQYLGGARGMRSEGILREKLANAEKHGAVGLLLVNDHVTAAEGDELMVFSQTAVDRSQAKIPAFQITRALVDTMLPADGRPLTGREAAMDNDHKPQSADTAWKASMDLRVRNQIDARNICGMLEGAGPLADETVVIGAHYDHWGYGGHGSLARMNKPTYGKPSVHHGADDNGSGTTTILEVARHFAAIPNRQGRRLVFLWFSGEELGLLGSIHYCQEPLFPLEKTVAMINLDMVGRLRPDKDTGKGRMLVWGTDTARELGAALDKANRKYDLRLVKQSRGTGVWAQSDHASFANKKVPVLFFFTDDHPQYHRPTDTVDTLNVTGMAAIAGLTEGIVTQVAAAPEPPKFLAPPPSGPGAVTIGFVPGEIDGKEGILVAGVLDETPAAKAGLKQGDRITSVGGQPVKNWDSFVPLLRTLKADEPVDFKVLRGGNEMIVKVTPQAGGGRRGMAFQLGIRPAYGDEKEGVLVEGVTEGRPAEKAGIKEGDRIIAIDGKPVKNLEDYMTVLREHGPGKALVVTVLRKDQKVELKVPLQ